MARYQATLLSRWTATETFGYLATFSNAAEWDPGVLAGEQLDAGPVGTGTRFRLVVPFLGRRLTLIYQVTSYQQDCAVVLTAVSGVLYATDTIVVAAGPGGSTVSYGAEVRFRGPLRLLDPLLRPGFRGLAARAVAGLGQALSRDPAAGTTVSPPAPVPPGPSRAAQRGTL